MATAREQFDKEAQSLVKIIRDLIDAGRLSDAGMLLDQYAIVNPSDPQIGELRKQLNALEGDTNRSSGTDSEIITPKHLPQDPSQILKRVESIFVVQSILAKQFGFMNSIIGKMKLMEEKYGYCSTLLTTTHDIDLRKKEAWLRSFTDKSRLISPGTKIENIYEYFQKSYTAGLENKAVYSRKKEKDGLSYVKASDNSFAVMDARTLVRIDVYSGFENSLRLERCYKNGKLEKDVYYDDWGYLNCIWEYNPENEKEYDINYYTTGGELRIQAHYTANGDSRILHKLTVFGEDGSTAAQMHSDSELTAYYLSQVLDDKKKYMLVLEAETRHNVAGLLADKRGNSGNIKVAAVVHSIFLKESPGTSGNLSDVPRPEYSYLCYNPEHFDGIVFLTRRAQEDYLNAFGKRTKTFTASHPFYNQIEKADFAGRDMRKAVAITRFIPGKEINATIDIFDIAVKTIPDARLEIYGFGPQQEQVEEHIKKLGIEENVMLMGYTDDTSAALKSAALYITSSTAEGFPLTLVESICNGCPVFSYDIRYGPSDIVKNGETGFLFLQGDVESFAAKVIEYFQNPDMQRIMSENCYADAPRFGMDVYPDKWLGIMNAICSS